MALAVASEPEIFWRGENAAQLVSAIRIPEAAGRLEAAGAGLNGPSGIALDKHYLDPLGLTRKEAWLCDLLPESRLNTAQAAAIKERYAPLAESLGLPAATIPPKPSRFASQERVEEIADEFFASGAHTLVTLGDAPLHEFVGHLKLHENTSLSAFGQASAEYGRRHPFTLRGRQFELLPLVHPRQAAKLGGYTPAWASCHASWVGRVGH